MTDELRNSRNLLLYINYMKGELKYGILREIKGIMF